MTIWHRMINLIGQTLSSPALLGIVVLLAPAGCGKTGPERHEVTGLVKVDGQPAERVVVQLENLDSTASGDDRYPVGITNGEGKFRIGEKSAQAGAIRGSYRVLFSWLSSPDLDAVDRFAGFYANAKNPDAQVIQVPVDGELTFDLKMPKR